MDEYIYVDTLYRYEDDGTTWAGDRYRHSLTEQYVVWWRKNGN